MKEVRTLFFSATDNTRKMVQSVADGLSKGLSCPISENNNVTPFASREKMYCFAGDCVAVIGFPVYAGRIPNKILPFFQNNVKGENTPAIAVLTYGNRAYDNALREIQQVLHKNGFVVIGALTQPSQHSFSSSVATGRPNNEDLAKAKKFGLSLAKKILAGNISDCLPVDEGELVYYTPLTTQGNKANILKVMPESRRDLCDSCGDCALRCPMGSIPKETPWETTGICIKCHACITHCPKGARAFTDEVFLSHKEMIEQNFSARKESEYFI